MAERSKFMGDMAGLAGGAVSVLAGVKDEIESLVRSRIEEAIRRLDLVRRDELDAVRELAANARAGQEEAEARLARLEAEVAALKEPPPPVFGGEGSNA